MAIPKFEALMLPLLKTLNSYEEIHFSEATQIIGKKLGLSEAEMAERYAKSNANKFHATLHFAGVYMGKAKLIERPKRGYVKITDVGKALLSKNPPSISKEDLYNYPSFVEWITKSQSSNDEDKAARIIPVVEDVTPEERIEIASREIEQILQADLLDIILRNTPAFFEKIIIDLLIAMGYGSGRSEMGRTLGQTGDGGVDGVINEDRLGLDVIYIQAKRYAPENKISPDQIRAFMGSLSEKKAHKGVFVTTSSYTTAALESARNSRERIILIDGEELTKLLIHYNVGVRIRSTYDIKRVDEDYFEQQ